MATVVNKLSINEAGTQLTIDIASRSHSNNLINSIIICKGQDVDFTGDVPIPGEDPLLIVDSADIMDNDSTQLTFNTVLNINNIDDSLLYVFVYYAAISTPTVIIPSATDIFCTYNLYTYVKNYILISRKINQNNPAPKELIDLIILRKTLEYALINGDHEKALEYFLKIKNYYV